MFNLKNTKTHSKETYESELFRDSPQFLETVNNVSSNIELHNLPEGCYISLQTSYVLVPFEVTPNVDAKTQYSEEK